jgi:hypothetical protein
MDFLTNYIGINNNAPAYQHDVVGVAAASCIKLKPTTYANLPVSPTFGMRAAITDSNTQDTAANYGATVAGGGSYNAFVKYNGSNWVIG